MAVFSGGGSARTYPKATQTSATLLGFSLSVVTQLWHSSAAHYNSPEASANDRWQRGTSLYLVVFACHCAYRPAATFVSLRLVCWLRAFHRNVSALISARFSAGVGGIEMRPRWVRRELKLRDKHCWTVGEKQMSRLVIMMTDRQAVKSLRSPINALCQKWAARVPRGCFQKNDSRFPPPTTPFCSSGNTNKWVNRFEWKGNEEENCKVWFFSAEPEATAISISHLVSIIWCLLLKAWASH